MKDCEMCGNPTNNEECPNPYDEEISGIINMEILCDQCFQICCDDV